MGGVLGEGLLREGMGLRSSRSGAGPASPAEATWMQADLLH